MTMILETMEKRVCVRRQAGRDALIISRTMAGELPEQIARDLLLSLAAVRSVLSRARERGVAVPSVSEIRKARDAKMVEWACGGMQPKVIAERLAIEPSEVSSRLAELRKEDQSIPKLPCGKPRKAPASPAAPVLPEPEIVERVMDLKGRGFRATGIAARLRLPYAVVNAAMDQRAEPAE